MVDVYAIEHYTQYYGEDDELHEYVGNIRNQKVNIENDDLKPMIFNSMKEAKEVRDELKLINGEHEDWVRTEFHIMSLRTVYSCCIIDWKLLKKIQKQL